VREARGIGAASAGIGARKWRRARQEFFKAALHTTRGE
jgi:hypothetical protein